MNSLKIVITMSYLSTGGAERVAVNYANWLVDNTNAKVFFILFNCCDTFYELNEKVNVIILEDKINLNNNFFKRVIKRFKCYKNVLNDIKPDVIFTMFSKTAFYSLISKNKNMLLISSERCNIKKISILKRIFNMLISMKCDGFIFQTKRMQSLYSKYVQKKSIVIPNAISIPKKSNVDREHLIVSMGRLVDQKGFDTLIEAFSLFSKNYLNYKLYIIGDGINKKELQSLINKLHLENKVYLLGNKSNPFEYLYKAEMFVLSSRYEGMPNALMEAMACGVPCIATDCETGPRELINNYENGILVDVDDILSISQKMTELASDNKLRRNLANNAKKILETNSPDKIYNMYYQYMVSVYKKSQSNKK